MATLDILILCWTCPAWPAYFVQPAGVVAINLCELSELRKKKMILSDLIFLMGFLWIQFPCLSLLVIIMQNDLSFDFFSGILCHDCTGTNCPGDITNQWSGKCSSKVGRCFIRKDPNGGRCMHLVVFTSYNITVTCERLEPWFFLYYLVTLQHRSMDARSWF